MNLFFVVRGKSFSLKWKRFSEDQQASRRDESIHSLWLGMAERLERRWHLSQAMSCRIVYCICQYVLRNGGTTPPLQLTAGDADCPKDAVCEGPTDVSSMLASYSVNVSLPTASVVNALTVQLPSPSAEDSPILPGRLGTFPLLRGLYNVNFVYTVPYCPG